jgi:oligoribonuclease
MDDSAATINDALVWLDCEMTGLDPNHDVILEIQIIITDPALITQIICPPIIINHPQHILNNMDEWCSTTHYQSGLTDKVLLSETTIQQAQTILLAFLEKHTIKGHCNLAGNSVHVDRQFLCASMPSIIDWLHYRIVDVSTIKLLARSWYPQEYKATPTKKVYTFHLLIA